MAIGALVAAHDLFCPQGQSLSEGVDRAIEKHPVMTVASIGYVAAHLVNILPPQVDVLHHLTAIKDRP